MKQYTKDQSRFRTLVFEKQETQQSEIIEYQIDPEANQINLNSLFIKYCDLSKHKVSIYDPNANKFIAMKKIMNSQGNIPRQYLQPRIVLFRYAKNNEYHEDSDSMDSSLQRQRNYYKNDSRSKERTISEVIELVKKWRNLHLYGHKSINRRMNLQDAAKLVGISKKTLDDYYCQLRLGQFYQFNFEDMLEQKIGVLRSFVKQYKPYKQTKRIHNQKHPKTLKVIQQYSVQTKKLKKAAFEENKGANMYGQQMKKQTKHIINEQKNSSQMKQQQDNRSRQGQNYASFFNQKSDSQPLFQDLYMAQNHFFKGFQYSFDEPQDPFFLIQRDFYKKPFDEDSNNSFYF